MKPNKLIDHMINLRTQAIAQYYLTDDKQKRLDLKDLIDGYTDIINWLEWRDKNNVDNRK